MIPSFVSASELARKIRERELSATDVVRSHLDRIARLNPSINAVVEVLEREALEQAREADVAVAEGSALGPLHGVPILIKDVHRVKRSLSTYGLPQYRKYRPETDSWVSEQMRRSGAICVGRSNVPVAGMDWQSWNPNYGRTLNPWDPARTPGGSSGGSAAAVASGLVPLDIGSDIGGSIRYPAHCCGVLGLRPSEHLVPNWRLQPEGSDAPFRHLLTSGPIARTFEDLELGLRALVGSEFRDEASVASRPLRIAWSDSLPGLEHLPLSEETRELFGNFVSGLRARGHSVAQAVPKGIDFRQALLLWGRIAGFEFTAGFPRLMRGRLARWFIFGPRTTHAVMGKGALSDGFNRGLVSGTGGYFAALTRRDELQMDFHRFFDSVDPIGIAKSGLPISVQVHAARHTDFTLLRNARALVSDPARPVAIPSGLSGW